MKNLLNRITSPWISFLEFVFLMVVLPYLVAPLHNFGFHWILVSLIFITVGILGCAINDYVNFKTKPRGEK